MSRTLAKVVLALGTSGPLVCAGQLQPPLRTWGPEAFGGARQVWDIDQAPDGTIGLANQAGVLLFDGVRWRTLANPGGTPLRSVRYDTAADAWWAGGYDAWYAWGETPTTHRPPPGPREEWWQTTGLPGDASLWQTFSRLAIHRADAAPTGVPGGGAILFAARVGGRTLVPTVARGILELRGGRLRRYRPSAEVLGGEAVGIVSLGGDSLLVGLRDGRLLAGPLDTLRGPLAAWPTTRSWASAGAQLNELLRLRDGRLAIGTVGAGVYVLSAAGAVQHHVSRADGLPDDTVLALHEDFAGDLWVGLDNGLAHLGLSSGSAFAASDVGAVYALAPLPAGGLLAGTNQGLFRVRDWTPERVPGFDEQVWHVTAADGGYVVGTNAGTFWLPSAAAEGSGGAFAKTGRPAPEPSALIGVLPGGWAWRATSDTTALAGTYAGVEGFSRRAGRWVSTGKLPGYNAPARQLAVDVCDAAKLYVVHPQEGLLRLDRTPGGRLRRSARPIVPYQGRLSLVATEGDGTEVRFISATIDSARAGGGCLVLHPANRLDDVPDGLPANRDYPSALALPDGRRVIGLTRGLAILPARDPLREAGREAWRPDGRVTVEVEERGARVRLLAPRFDRAPRWRAQLIGVDTAMGPWTERGEMAFPLLPSGDYTLAYETDLAAQPRAVSWTIPPRWYETAWAYLAYVLLGLGAFLLIRRYYHRRLRAEARAAEREAAAAARERETQLAAERLTRRAAEAEAESRALETEVERNRRRAALREAEARRLEVDVERGRREAAEREGEIEHRNREIEHRNRELARVTMALAKQNEALLQVRASLAPLPKGGDTGKVRRQLLRLVDDQLATEEDWAFFQQHFDVVHEGFTRRLRDAHPDLTAGDLRLASLLRMNLPSKEIAPLLHISLRGVENKRYRLRKKLALGAEDQLSEWVLDF